MTSTEYIIEQINRIGLQQNQMLERLITIERMIDLLREEQQKKKEATPKQKTLKDWILGE